MENKLSKRHSYLVKKINADIHKKEELIERVAQKMKEAVAGFDTQQIIAFVPGYVSRIEDLKRELKVLEEKMQMLEWMCDEE